MKQRKIPLRTCVITKESLPKSELLRVVRTPEGDVQVDETGKLNGEKIDVVEYSNDSARFIENALSPAKNLTVVLGGEKENEALVIVDDENLSLAIGKKGQNVRLAARLTHYKIDVKTRSEAREMGINIL